MFDFAECLKSTIGVHNDMKDKLKVSQKKSKESLATFFPHQLDLFLVFVVSGIE